MTGHTIEYVDPQSVQIGPNVRTIDPATLDPAFVQSIRERGVVQPVVGYRSEGVLMVLTGQRRTLAACLAGLESMPMIIIDEDLAEHDRIFDQLAENDQRKGLNQHERVDAIEQLALIGLPVSEIAQQLAMDEVDVARARKAAGSKAAGEVLQQYNLTLEQAAELVEFEDYPELVQELTRAAVEGGWGHRLQGAYAKREGLRLVAGKLAELDAEGVRAVEVKGVDEYDSRDTDDTVVLGVLRPAVSEKEHESCPGHAVGVAAVSVWSGRERTYEVRTAPVCVDFRSHGHAHRWDPVPPATPEDDAAADAARIEREKAAAEKKAAEKAKKEALAAAAEVRQSWIGALIAGKLPTDLLVAASDWLMSHYAVNRELIEGWTAGVAGSPRVMAEKRIAAAFLSSREADFATGPWRIAHDVEHLGLLGALGYEFTDVEADLFDNHTPDEDDDDE